MRLAYVCQDPGIAPDGTKGASVHFRKLGRALREAFDGEVVTYMARAPRNGACPPGVNVVAAAGAAVGASGGVARELALLAGQGPLLDALVAAPPVDALYERYSLFGLASTTFAKARSIPHLVEVNAPLWEEASAYRGLELVELARQLGRTVMAGATKVLAVSEALAQRVVDLGVSADRVEIFPNGVDADLFRDPVAAELPAPLLGRPVALFAGSLKPWHGLDVLLRELARDRWSDLGVWVVGDGPLRQEVEAFVREHSHRAAWWRGVDHDRMPAVYAAASFSVAPYPVDAPDYFSPLKIVESLGAGCPVLTTEACRLPSDLDAPGVFRFSAAEAKSLERVLASLVENLDAARREARTMRGHVLRHHTWQARAESIRDWITPRTSRPEPTECAR